MTDDALGHGGEHRHPLPAMAVRARHPGSGMRGVGEDDVPVGFRPPAPGGIGEAVPPRIRGIGGLAVTGGAIPCRRRPGIGGVPSVAGGARAFRDGHVAVVTERPFPRCTRHHQHRGPQNEGEHAAADVRHPSDGTGEPGRRQARGGSLHSCRGARPTVSNRGLNRLQPPPEAEIRRRQHRTGSTAANHPTWSILNVRPATAGQEVTLTRTASGARQRRRRSRPRARPPSR